MTAWHELAGRLGPSNSPADGRGGEESDAWESAPAPAEVAKRVLEGVFGRQVAPDRIPLLTNVVH
jgi:hypothetical protein